MESIRSLGSTSFDDIYTAWQSAFAGYEKTWTREELQADLIRRGYDAALSFGAFEGDKLVGFVLNGIGDYQGLRTAYDTGTGTIPEARGRGLTKKIFEASLPLLKNAGVVQYVLEVLQRNEPAINIYTSFGFRISRELAYFMEEVQNVQRAQQKPLPSGIRLRAVSLNDLHGLQTMWDFEPSWQNSTESIRRRPEVFVATGAFDGDRMIGYGIIDPPSGDIPQMAVDKDYRRKGVGTAILAALLQQNNKATVKLINVEATADSMIQFLDSHGMTERGRQYEMIREID